MKDNASFLESDQATTMSEELRDTANKLKHDFNSFLEAMGVGQPQTWVDEKYAAPVDKDLLTRFYNQQLSDLAADYVLDQITGFRSWRDAFLDIVREQSHKSAPGASSNVAE